MKTIQELKAHSDAMGEKLRKASQAFLEGTGQMEAWEQASNEHLDAATALAVELKKQLPRLCMVAGVLRQGGQSEC